jgi:uncharacterized protein (DUF2235 family)
MAKNIVLLSDGTGNSSAKLFTTNVWRLYQALDVSDPKRQVAHYDNGVGTSSFKPLAILGGVFGFGLKRNVLDLYRFLCRNYKKDDRIFGFGFSRGSFTIRVLAGLVARQGLVPYDGNEAHLARDARVAYRAYRKRFNVTIGLVVPLRWTRDRLLRMFGTPEFDPKKQTHPDAIHFLGVWDTVAAYGGPIEEVTRGIDYWLWPLSMPDRFMSARIRRACHALALDDERNAFWPLLWDERYVSGPQGRLQPMAAQWSPPTSPNLPDIDRQRLSQVWFTGMHSDVGGGYAQDGLSYAALRWMVDRAIVYDLLIKPTERARLTLLANELDKLNDSRHGLAGYYRYKPRKLADLYAAEPYKPTIGRDLAHVARTIKRAMARGTANDRESELRKVDDRPSPIIHESVFERIKAGTEGYSPIVLPGAYRVTTKAGDIRSGVYEQPTQAATRANQQERTWNWVWARRVAYFATVFASLFLVALPLIEKFRPGLGPASPFEWLIPVVAALAHFLPGLVTPWIAAFKNSPERLAMGGVLVAALLLVSGSLQGRIGDVMRGIWQESLNAPPSRGPVSAEPDDVLYRVRTASVYRGFFYALTHWVLPTIFAFIILLSMLYGGSVLVSRAFFAAASASGFVCRGSGGGGAPMEAARTVTFETKDLCGATGLAVRKGSEYRVTLRITDAWEDGHDSRASDPRKAKGIETGPNGFGQDKAIWTMAPGIPFRRLAWSNWFQTVVRVGSRGFEEHVPVFAATDGSVGGCGNGRIGQSCTATFTARSDGDVFIFVNDAVFGVPGLFDRFYRTNNRGKAEVTFEPIR